MHFGEIINKSLFPPIPASEPIPAPGPIPNFKKIPVGTLATANEMEPTPSCEFHGRNLPEDDQNFWTTLGPLSTSLISILISLMIHCIIYYKHLRGWHREDETEQKLSQLRMLVQEGDSFMLELTTTLALVKDAKVHRHAQFQNVMDSVRKMMMERDERYTEVQNDMDSMKMLMKVEDERRAQFQNAMDSMKNMMNMENKRRGKFRDKMDSLKMMMKRTPSMPME
jgi:hypothetical protein